MDDLGLFWINPLEIETCLKRADYKYPSNREADFGRGWSNFPVIPELYKLTRRLGHYPMPDEGIVFLMKNCDPRYQDNEKVIKRGQKLYMDFGREIHTLGLLQQCSLFAGVWYQKALDMSMNIDYLASLLSMLGGQRVAVQAAMRARWPENIDDDPYEQLKAERRRRRGEIRWNGQIYWLTNRNRPYYKAINGCWLFGPSHINDLTEEIRGNGDQKIVAIQTEMAL